MTEPAHSLFKVPIATDSLQEGLERATAALSTQGPGGRVVLSAVVDDGHVGGRVSATFKRVRASGSSVAIGVFGEVTLQGERRAGGVVAWEWGK